MVGISENASKYMKQFFNNTNEQYIESELVELRIISKLLSKQGVPPPVEIIFFSFFEDN